MHTQTITDLEQVAEHFANAAEGYTSYMGGQWLTDLGRAYRRAADELRGGHVHFAAALLRDVLTALTRTNRDVTDLLNATLDLIPPMVDDQVIEESALLVLAAAATANIQRARLIQAVNER